MKGISVKKALRYSIYGLLVYLIFLVVLFPASRAYSIAQQQMELPKIYGIDGSVWSGTADSLLLGSETFKAIEWGFHPFALFLGRVEYGLGFNNGDSHAHGSISRSFTGALALSELDAQIPATKIASYIGFDLLGFGGTVNVKIDHIGLSAEGIESIDAVVNWDAAEVISSVTSPSAVPLGGITLSFDTTDKGIVGVLSDDGGPLEVAGSLKINGDQYDFAGKFSAREGVKSPIQQALNMMGRPDKNGKVELKESGKIPRL